MTMGEAPFSQALAETVSLLASSVNAFGAVRIPPTRIQQGPTLVKIKDGSVLNVELGGSSRG
jgi:hypothetical protein